MKSNFIKILCFAILLTGCEKADINTLDRTAVQLEFENVVLNYSGNYKEIFADSFEERQEREKIQTHVQKERETQLAKHVPDLQFKKWAAKLESVSSGSSALNRLYMTLDMSRKGGGFSFLCYVPFTHGNKKIMSQFSAGQDVYISGKLNDVYPINGRYRERIKTPEFICTLDSVSRDKNNVLEFVK